MNALVTKLLDVIEEESKAQQALPDEERIPENLAMCLDVVKAISNQGRLQAVFKNSSTPESKITKEQAIRTGEIMIPIVQMGQSGFKKALADIMEDLVNGRPSS